MGREHAVALLRAARLAGAHVPARTGAGHFRPGHSGNRGGLAAGALPRPQPPDLIAKEYRRVLLSLWRRAWEAMRAPLARELPGLLAANAAARAHHDADEAKRAAELVRLAGERAREVLNDRDLREIAARFAAETSTHQRIQFNRQTRAALGVDFPLTDARSRAAIEAMIEANVGLVQNIGDKVRADLRGIVLGAVQRGGLWDDVADDVDSRFQFGEARSALIARDQIGKLNGQLNAARQQEIGARKFRWKVVDDERVRGRPDGLYPKAEPSHWAFRDKVYSYDDPPEGLLPGEDYQCRCYAEPVFDDLLAELDDLG